MHRDIRKFCQQTNLIKKAVQDAFVFSQLGCQMTSIFLVWKLLRLLVFDWLNDHLVLCNHLSATAETMETGIEPHKTLKGKEEIEREDG